MPRRSPANAELIQQTHERTGSARETARILGLHENTVYITLRRLRGLCKSGCARQAASGSVYCEQCLDRLAARKRVQRAEKRRLGICYECDEQVDMPLSRTLCRTHRLASLDASRVRQEEKRLRRRGTHQGKPNLRQRERWIKEAYKPGGLAAWHRDGASCVICQAAFGEKTIHLHHIDLDRSNNAEDNFACLCFDCHRLVHAILGNPHAKEALAWAARTYPGLKAPGHEALSTPTGRSA